MYGNRLEPNRFNTGRVGVIADPDSSPSGNVILRTGRWQGPGWTQTEHIVLTPEEALDLGIAICAAAAAGTVDLSATLSTFGIELAGADKGAG